MQKPKSLVTKLCSIMREVDSVAKRGKNELADYVYATEGDIKEAFRGALLRRRVLISPRVLETRRFAVSLSTRSGNVDTFITEASIEWTFRDGDTLETFTCVVDGAGEDQSDKGVYKALTGSLKSLLMATFLIRSGDDPDADTKATGKELREKKVEAAKEVGKQIAEGTHTRATPLPLWFTTLNEQEVAVRGADDALLLYRDELSYRGTWNAKKKYYVVGRDRLDDLKYVLGQLKCELKEVSDATH